MSRIEKLEKRLAADPSSRIFVQLAEEYRKQGLLDNAIEICEQGLKKHPQYPSARVALGRALLEAETFDRAREEFEAVLAQVPDNILANKFLGETYHRLGRYDEAIQKYQIAQTLAPEDTELEEQIEAVKAEQAGGGPPPPAVPEPADETAPADPAEYTSQPPAVPIAAAPAGTDEPLEPTLVDARAVVPAQVDVRQPPPPPAPAASATPAPAEEAPPAPDEPAELAPIPLVDVDEPMVLESASESYARASEPGAEAAPPEPVPIVSPTEPSPMEPLEPLEPASMEPPPLETPPREPPAMEEPRAFEPPAAESQPPPLPPPQDASEAMPVVEPLPVESLPVEPLPVEPAVPSEHAAEPTPSSDDIETPTMAELYASQGHFDKAVLVYRNLLTRDPNETQYLERIEELEMLANASADSATAAPAATVEARGDGLSEFGRQQTIEVLEQWLDGIRRSRGA